MNALPALFCLVVGPFVAFASAQRPPAVPLVPHDPYFSIWSRSDKLYDSWPSHWTGRTQALQSMILVDGDAYRLMGVAPTTVPPLEQRGLEVTPTRATYSFGDARVSVKLTFLTPLLPDDLELLSRPVTYIEWEVTAVDGKSHEIALHFDCSAELAVDSTDQLVTWNRADSKTLSAVRLGTVEQPVLAKAGDDLRIDWGYVYVASPAAEGARCLVTSDVLARSSFAESESARLSEDSDKPRAAKDRWPVLSCDISVGAVDAKGARRHVLLAYDDGLAIQYMSAQLPAFWKRKGATIHDVLELAERDRESIIKRCAAFDRALTADMTAAGGATYAWIGALAYQQCLAGNKLVADANGQPLLFPKENFSNGCIGTVDVIYPMSPLFLLMGSDLARAMLVPVLDYGSSARWTFPFAPHDLGTYPHATGQVYGGGEKSVENQMPVEESGNLILLVAALAKAEGDSSFAHGYWNTLESWARYLDEKGFDPENQLCTDDFAGHLAHNVNLSAKSILALGAWSNLCTLEGMAERAAIYRAKAEVFAKRWVELAIDGDHTRLAFDKPGTWSQKYNLVWDRLLDLSLFPDDMKRREMEHYKRVQRPFGLPLDSRKDYTKLDWITWSASITGKRADFEALVNPIAKFLNESPDRAPMCDWYQTTDGRNVNMIARPVVGGVFVRLLDDDTQWKRWFARGPRSKSAWAPIPLEKR